MEAQEKLQEMRQLRLKIFGGQKRIQSAASLLRSKTSLRRQNTSVNQSKVAQTLLAIYEKIGETKKFNTIV